MQYNVHLIFDLIAAVSAFVVTLLTYRWRLAEQTEAKTPSFGGAYAIVLIGGAVIGGYGLGSLNLYISGTNIIGRSILGALAGAILGVELFKWVKGINRSTGLVFVGAFATTVAIGRLGCFYSGLDDNTYGIPTSLPWGHNFGDGILRHPVQLYEAAAMAIFLIWFLVGLGHKWSIIMTSGFYPMVVVYASQRFVWEFLKPYATLVGPLNLFHLVCLGLLAYAGFMMMRRQHVSA